MAESSAYGHGSTPTGADILKLSLPGYPRLLYGRAAL